MKGGKSEHEKVSPEIRKARQRLGSANGPEVSPTLLRRLPCGESPGVFRYVLRRGSAH
jgi:hypothetical protein